MLPNSRIINTEIVNFSALTRAHGPILHTSLRIGYGVPWKKVESLPKEDSGRVGGPRTDPPPFVREKSLDNFALTYELNAVCNEPARIYELHAELHRTLVDVFDEFGCQDRDAHLSVVIRGK